MKAFLLTVTATAVFSVCLIVSAAGPSGSATSFSAAVYPALPAEAMAKSILNTTHRHREWMDVPAGSSGVRTFVVYPERADKAPVVVLAETKQGASDWIRAVGDQLAGEGYIAVIPDVLSGMGPRGGDGDSFPNRAAAASALDGSMPSVSGRSHCRRPTGAAPILNCCPPPAILVSTCLSLGSDPLSSRTAGNGRRPLSSSIKS